MKDFGLLSFSIVSNNSFANIIYSPKIRKLLFLNNSKSRLTEDIVIFHYCPLFLTAISLDFFSINDMELSGAEILVKSLTDHHLNTYFGYQGSCIMQVMDCFYDNKQIEHILVRHEQGAVHAACGYAYYANKPGVVLVTSGPGATNTVTGIADAYSSGIPLIVITGQVASTMLGTDAFQEADMINITSSITKWNCQIRKADQIADAVYKAIKIATSDRPGPVLLDITKDAQTGKAEYCPATKPIDCNCISAIIPSELVNFPQKKLYDEIIQILKNSAKDILLAVDKIPNDFYIEGYFEGSKVIKSKLLGVSGFGLPAAIGARYAMPDKTVCLVAGELEFQATIKELGIILEQGLDVKMAILTHSANNMFEVIHPDFIKIASAYGINGYRVAKKENLAKDIQEMLNYKGSYLLEINEDLFK